MAEAVASISSAADWIAEVSPEHHAWVSRLIRGYAITQMPQGCELSSGSYQSRPGLVHISMPLDKVLIAETLVHEASHQHYFLMNTVAKMVRPGPSQSVYSPIKKMQRPVDRTLFALHACHNIAAFFAKVRASDASAAVEGRYELMAGYTREMTGTLRRPNELAPAGLALVETLASQAPAIHAS